MTDTRDPLERVVDRSAKWKEHFDLAKRCERAEAEARDLLNEVEWLKKGLVEIADPTITDIGELKNMARELLGWPAVEQPLKTA